MPALRRAAAVAAVSDRLITQPVGSCFWSLSTRPLWPFSTSSVRSISRSSGVVHRVMLIWTVAVVPGGITGG
jgi:hypothetical protein